MTKRVLVIGKTGQLGQSLQKVASEYPQFQLEFVGRDQLDLADKQSVRGFFGGLAQPYAGIINAAAYTAVDQAESEPELAERINHLAVAQLAQLACEQGSFLLHVSTDYVFDGQAYRPYVETDMTAPLNIYGASKLRGEQAFLASGCRGAIVRTSWVYSEFGNNFVKTMLHLGREREQLGVVFDQIGTPTYATDLARACLHLLSEAKVQGVYHYSNEGVCSWFDFAKAIFDLSGVACLVSPITTEAYPTPARRPHYTVLNKQRIKQETNLNIPYWRDSLQTCLEFLEQ